MRYAKKRHYSWNYDLAYVAGLMASDGHISKDGRHIDLTSKDSEQLSNFNTALGRKTPISTKNSGRDQYAYRVQVSDVALYDFLVDAGIKPNKSKTIGCVKVPDMYYCDFLRGVFDGDGTCYGFWDKRWKSSFMFYISFTSASEDFLRFIQRTNTRIIGVGKGSLNIGARTFNLSYAKNDSHKLYEAFYSIDTELFLSRKKKKLDRFIAEDKKC